MSQYWLNKDGEATGPFSKEALADKLANNELTADAEVHSINDELGWMPVSRVIGIAPNVNSGSVPGALIAPANSDFIIKAAKKRKRNTVVLFFIVGVLIFGVFATYWWMTHRIHMGGEYAKEGNFEMTDSVRSDLDSYAGVLIAFGKKGDKTGLTEIFDIELMKSVTLKGLDMSEEEKQEILKDGRLRDHYSSLAYSVFRAGEIHFVQSSVERGYPVLIMRSEGNDYIYLFVDKQGGSSWRIVDMMFLESGVRVTSLTRELLIQGMPMKERARSVSGDESAGKGVYNELMALSNYDPEAAIEMWLKSEEDIGDSIVVGGFMLEQSRSIRDKEVKLKKREKLLAALERLGMRANALAFAKLKTYSDADEIEYALESLSELQQFIDDPFLDDLSRKLKSMEN